MWRGRRQALRLAVAFGPSLPVAALRRGGLARAMGPKRAMGPLRPPCRGRALLRSRRRGTASPSLRYEDKVQMVAERVPSTPWQCQWHGGMRRGYKIRGYKIRGCKMLVARVYSTTRVWYDMYTRVRHNFRKHHCANHYRLLYSGEAKNLRLPCSARGSFANISHVQMTNVHLIS